MSQTDETRIALLENNHQTMMEKLNEFQEDNREQHTLIVDALNKLENKLDGALEKKADKEVVDSLKSKVDDLNDWKLKILGGVAVIAVLFSIFKEQILDVFK